MAFGAGMARILLVVGVLCAPMDVAAQAARDSGRDFDWEIGAWDTLVRVRTPLSTEENWTELRGTSVVHAFSGGRANLVDLDVANFALRIQGVSLRLFNPQTQQWSLNFASMREGVLTPPVYGGFSSDRGVFYGQDHVDGRVVLVRFVISDVTQTTAHFEQAYSTDGGQSWVVNWIAVDTRRR